MNIFKQIGNVAIRIHADDVEKELELLKSGKFDEHKKDGWFNFRDGMLIIRHTPNGWQAKTLNGVEDVSDIWVASAYSHFKMSDNFATNMMHQHMRAEEAQKAREHHKPDLN